MARQQGPDQSCHTPDESQKCDFATGKIYPQHVTRQKVQAQNPVDSRAWRQSVRKNSEVHPLLAQGCNPLQPDRGDEFNTAPGADLDALRGKPGITANRYQKPGVDQSRGGAGVKRQA